MAATAAQPQNTVCTEKTEEKNDSKKYLKEEKSSIEKNSLREMEKARTQDLHQLLENSVQHARCLRCR